MSTKQPVGLYSNDDFDAVVIKQIKRYAQKTFSDSWITTLGYNVLGAGWVLAIAALFQTTEKEWMFYIFLLVIPIGNFIVGYGASRYQKHEEQFIVPTMPKYCSQGALTSALFFIVGCPIYMVLYLIFDPVASSEAYVMPFFAWLPIGFGLIMLDSLASFINDTRRAADDFKQNGGGFKKAMDYLYQRTDGPDYMVIVPDELGYNFGKFRRTDST